MQIKIITSLSYIALISSVYLSSASASPLAKPEHNFNKGRLSFITQELNLTTIQEKQFKQIIRTQHSVGKAWQKQHHQATEKKLSTILNVEQMEKFLALKKQRIHDKKRHHTRHF